MRRSIKRACTALVTMVMAAGVVILSTSNAEALTSTAARSVVVKLINNTGCTLVVRQAWVFRGDWIPGGELAYWGGEEIDYKPYPNTLTFGSESNGFMTGTEGNAYFGFNYCSPYVGDYGNWINPLPAVLKLHWLNPYVGSNSYDSIGSDPLFKVYRSGGSGNNATVTFTVCLKQRDTALNTPC
jgi:hypothetical protein